MMNRAVKIVAIAFGLFASIGSIEHGVFEMLQGRIAPDGLMIESMGPPCVPELTWNACEPAMTIVPDFFVTGVLAILFGVFGVVWSVLFIGRKYGGHGLILLSLGMLLFGGGIFPPLIGMISGAVATRIDKPLAWWRGQQWLRPLAILWPWSLVLLFVWLIGQWIIGAFFNDWLLRNGVLILILIPLLLLLSVLSAFANDVAASDLRAANR